MNIRTLTMKIGAAILLLIAIILPVSAAGWETDPGYDQTAGNSADCPDCIDCEKHRYRHGDQVSSGSPTTVEQNQNSGDGAVLKVRTGYQCKVDRDGIGQGSCDEERSRKQLQDGSCGGCPRA